MFIRRCGNLRSDPPRFDSRTIDPNSKSVSVGWMMLRVSHANVQMRRYADGRASSGAVAELAQVREQLFTLHALRLQRESEQTARWARVRHRRNFHRARRQRTSSGPLRFIRLVLIFFADLQ